MTALEWMYIRESWSITGKSITWFVSVLVNGRNEPPYLNVGILQLQMPISFWFPLQVHMAVGNWIWLHIHLEIYASLICMNTKRENRLHSPPFIRSYSYIIFINYTISMLIFNLPIKLGLCTIVGKLNLLIHVVLFPFYTLLHDKSLCIFRHFTLLFIIIPNQ